MILQRLAVEFSEGETQYYLYTWVDNKEYKVSISEQEYEHLLYSTDVEGCFN
jgi:hypothetical protein